MSHLKRLTAPRTWNITRKDSKFIVRPLPGSHARASSVPLQLVLRDMLGYVGTARHVRATLAKSAVFVDGKKRTQARSSVGLFDVIHILPTNEYYRIMLDYKGSIALKKIDPKEGNIKICKVVGKRKIAGGKIQLSLHDGRTMLNESQISVGDSVLLKLPEAKVEQVVQLKNGAYIYLIKGKYSGSHGILEEINKDEIIYRNDANNKIRTSKRYAVAVGEGKPLINLNHGA